MKERIKKLEEKFWNNVLSWTEIQEHIRTVAAEAREEGIEWMIQCAIAEINNMATTFRDTELLMEVKRRIRENGQAQLAKKDERLKKQTKEVAHDIHDSMWGGGPKDGG